MNSKAMTFKSFKELQNADVVWLQFWAELPDRDHVQRFQQFIDSYVTDQKASGRFPRPLNNHLYNVEQWLRFNNVVGTDNRILLVLAFMFLGVCLLNTVGLMLAKFLGLAPVAGLRRALGASSRDILRQHLMEVIVIGLLGGLFGLGLAKWGLAIRAASFARVGGNPEQIAMIHLQSHVDGTVLALALALSLLAAVLAGLYPAWRICRMSPAAYLKTQ
jgi:putative ABC transport system permease protein